MAEETQSNPEGGTFAADHALESTSREPASPTVQIADDGSKEIHRSALALLVTIPEAELTERLRMAVEEAAAGNVDSMEGLRLAVCEFTVALKDEGTSPEAVLITLKTVIHNRSVLGTVPHAGDWKGQLREQVSTWCIEEYFREKTA